jgi:hypothetical protein
VRGAGYRGYGYRGGYRGYLKRTSCPHRTRCRVG